MSVSLAREPANSTTARSHRPAVGPVPVKGKIWIDLDNSPHVPFFAPVVAELERRGYTTILTARDCFQVNDLASRMHLSYKLIGRHFGKNTAWKLTGLCWRALQLTPTIVKEKPDLAVSHGSRSQLIVATSLRIPSVQITDYEFATGSVVIYPTWQMCPEVIPDTALHDRHRVLKYPGIKEDVYVPQFKADPAIRRELGLRDADLVVTLRPPATEAHYHTPKSDELFDAAVEFLSRIPDVKLVAVPRNDKQGAAMAARWPGLLASGQLRFPQRVVDGLNLIWYSDLVISGGGTMNREAAALGVPVYSVFRGQIGAVDQYLSRTGRLVLIEHVEDIPTKIAVVRRRRPAKPASHNNAALWTIVDHIAHILESTHAAVTS